MYVCNKDIEIETKKQRMCEEKQCEWWWIFDKMNIIVNSRNLHVVFDNNLKSAK